MISKYKTHNKQLSEDVSVLRASDTGRKNW